MMERYHSPGYAEEKRKLAEWLCLPSDSDMGGLGSGYRQPSTLTALAAELGVSKEVLSRWQRDPVFIAMKHTVKKQVTLDLEDEFLHRMTIALLKPGTNYDRIFMVWERYAKPALEGERDRGEWDQFLGQSNSANQRIQKTYAHLLTEFRTLPVGQRETFLTLLEKAMQAEDIEQVGEYETFSPRRIHTGDDEEPDQLPALPAPAATPRDTTDTTPRYDPGRGIRKPIRKPRDTKR
jgi:hypothetical protein